MSTDYYTRLERGDLSGVSERMLSSLALALQLSAVEAEHLVHLAKNSNGGTLAATRPKRNKSAVRPQIQRILDSIGSAPATLIAPNHDIVATNTLAAELYSSVTASPFAHGAGSAYPNLARFTFLDPAASTFWPDWEGVAAGQVATLRHLAALDPHDVALHEVVGALTTQSAEFSRLWARYGVSAHHSGKKRVNHPVVGELAFDFEMVELPADPGLALFIYSAPDESVTASRLLALEALALEGTHRTSQPTRRRAPQPDLP